MIYKNNISPEKWKLIIYCALLLITLVIFWQVYRYDFVNFDDYVYVIENDHIQSGITWDGIHWAFSTTYAEFWHPLTWLSLIFDYQLHSMSPGGYHITNLILHILSTLLLFWLFNRMTLSIWKSAFVAALFALHPLHVESVAWIAERKDVLSAFFYMLTLCLYVYYTEKPVLKRYFLVLFCFVLALMSKPMVITLPVIMLLLDYWPLGRFQSKKIATREQENISNPADKKKKKNKGTKEVLKKNISSPQVQKLPEVSIVGKISLWQLWEKIPFFILSAIFSIITIYAHPEIHTPQWQHNLESRIMNAIVSFGIYLEKTLWPHDLAAFYPFSDQIPLWQVFGSVILITIISVAVIFFFKRLPYLFVGWLWFAITLLPVIGIVPVGDFAMADRYHYLPSIGLAVMLAWGIPSLIKRKDIRKNILFPTGIAFLGIMAVLTWRQCSYWKDTASLFNHALQVTKDNYLAHYSLSDALINEGKNKEAIYHYDEAIRLKPDCALAYYNRGTLYNKLEQYQLAIEDFTKAITFQQNYADAFYNRGNAYIPLGQYQRAIEDFSQAIIQNPAYFKAYSNRASAYLLLGNKELGCYDAQKACAMGLCRSLEWAKGNGFCR